MFKEVLQHIEGIEIWPIVSLILFFSAFLFVVWRVIRLDKQFVNHMGELPLEDSSDQKGGEING